MAISKKLFLFCLIIALTSCAFGRKISYQAPLNLAVDSNGKSVIVAVHDLRPYVQTGKKPSTFVGIQKSIYGIPFDVNTKSGKPFADDLGFSIVSGLKSKQISSVQQIVPCSWSFAQFRKNVLEARTDNVVYYFTLIEWKTETHFRPALHYDVALKVFDEEGVEMESNREKGFFYFDKSQPGRENVTTATSAILDKLFLKKSPSDNQIVAQ